MPILEVYTLDPDDFAYTVLQFYSDPLIQPKILELKQEIEEERYSLTGDDKPVQKNYSVYGKD